MDSYQDDRYLPFWDEADVDIRVIHLTRDVELGAFAITQGAPKKVVLPELRPLLRWWRLNARDESVSRNSGIGCFAWVMKSLPA